MNYRNRKLLDLAKGKPCMNCEGKICSPDTTVAAHSNLQEHGRGFAFRSHDCFIAWLGNVCHQWLDHGKGADPTGVYQCTREDKSLMFRRAMERTQKHMWENQMIEVA